MTVTLDSKSLHVSRLNENVKTVISVAYKWASSQVKRDISVLGATKNWALDCYEDNVAWDSSACKHFQTKAASGDSVAFVVSEGDMHSVSCNVYIVGCDLTYKRGVKKEFKHRAFTVTLVEAQ